MRTFRSIVDEARLVASPPDVVVSYIEERGSDKEHGAHKNTTDEQLEQALLARHNPLINLSLARWCRYAATGVALLANNRGSTTYALAIRLSLLANVSVGVVDILSRVDENITNWLPSASDEELSALFNNPSLGDDFLETFFNGGPSWQCMSDAQRLTVLRALSENPRMSQRYDKLFTDGFDEHRHNKVFEAAWKMAETVPTSRPWAYALGWLFDVLLPVASGVSDPLVLTARWNLPEDEGVTLGQLSSYQNVRKGLGRLALAKNTTHSEEFRASADPALRAAVYATCPLDAAAINQAIERDGELAFEQLLSNVQLWQRKAEREALRQGARAVAESGPRLDLMPYNSFDITRERMEREYPTWFADITLGDPDALDLPATREDVQRVLDNLTGDAQTTGYQSVTQAIQVVHKRLGWVWWFSLGALLMALGHHL